MGMGFGRRTLAFSLRCSAPSVVAVLVESSYPDRVAENINSVCQKVPDNFWASMKEEGLLAKEWQL